MIVPRSESVSEQAALAGLSEPAQRWADAELSGQELFERLCAAKLPTDALKLLPHLLSKRAAVWWGCLCVYQAERAPASETALAAAIQWVQDPCEETRRSAERAAAACGGLTTAPGCLALAAFWSGGSMTPPDLPTVPPPPHLTASVVAGAVLLAASPHALHHWLEIQQQFLELGRNVACGRLPWQGAEPRRRFEKSRGQKRRLEAVGAGAEEQR